MSPKFFLKMRKKNHQCRKIFFLPSEKISDFLFVVEVIVLSQLHRLLNVHLPGVEPHVINKSDVALLKVISDLKLVLASSQLRLDLAERVAENGEEHVEQDKEHEKYKEKKIERTEELVGLREGDEVKVPENCSDESKDCVVERAVVEYLSSEQQISQLYEGREDDEEHDEESKHVSRTLQGVALNSPWKNSRLV